MDLLENKSEECQNPTGNEGSQGDGDTLQGWGQWAETSEHKELWGSANFLEPEGGLCSHLACLLLSLRYSHQSLVPANLCLQEPVLKKKKKRKHTISRKWRFLLRAQ